WSASPVVERRRSRFRKPRPIPWEPRRRASERVSMKPPGRYIGVLRAATILELRKWNHGRKWCSGWVAEGEEGPDRRGGEPELDRMGLCPCPLCRWYGAGLHLPG